MDCEQLCTCFFCLSPIRTYMVQVQNQAQEQELFPPVKWVLVKCIIGHPGASKTNKKNRQGLCKLDSVSCLWTFTSFISPVSPILFLHSSYSWIIADCWRPESVRAILHLDSMEFWLYMWKLHAVSHFSLMLGVHETQGFSCKLG